MRDSGVPRGALYPKLRPGPGRSTDQVIANQRARLIGAMIELVAERGYSGVTVRGLSRLAGVSTKTFYECFENAEDCFAATYGRIVRDTLRRATALPHGLDGRLRARVRAFFEALGEEPKAAHLVLVDSLSAGPALMARTRVSRRALERFIRDELVAAARPVPIHSGIAEGAAAAALHLGRSWLLATDRRVSALAAADEYADWLLVLGSTAAFRGHRHIVKAAADTGLEMDLVPDIRDDRGFLLAAVTRLSVRDGYARLTVPAICREAGIPRRSFDQHFDGIADCFLAAIETGFSDALGRATRQAEAAPSWERGIVRAVALLCTETAREPGLAQLGLVDILAPGEIGLQLRERLIIRWARALRLAAPANARPRQLTAEVSVAAAMGIAATDAASGRVERIGRAVPSLAFVILAPAIGPAAAERAIARELRAA